MKTIPMKTATLKQANLSAAQALAARLNTPASEILDMVTSAGLDAVEKTLAHRGKLTLPLAFETAGDIVPPIDARTVTEFPAVPGMGKRLLIALLPPETLPVHLPARDVMLLRELCKAAGIADGLEGLASAWLEEIAANSLQSNVRKAAHLAHGALDLISSGWNLGDDHGAAMERMQDVVDRWTVTAPPKG